MLSFPFPLGLLTTALAASSSEWRGRSIYQVFTDRFARTDGSTTASCSPGYQGYCGGTWAGITNHLDYIRGMGFDAIWISPIVEQVDDPTRGFNGYSAKDAYSLNNNFGSAAELNALATALHSRGMYLMVDVVVNHFAWSGSAEETDYSTFNPFNDSSYFHPICWVTDYTNQTNVEQCWLGNDQYPLPDVDTTLDVVRSMWFSWVTWLVSTYSIDGLRVDTVKHVEQPFWPGFNEAAGVYAVGEVADGNVDYVCPYQNYIDGVLGYPNYYQATEFYSNPLANSTNFVNEVQYMNQACKDTTLLGSFSENHDQPRFASVTSDIVLAKNIVTFTILADGIPIIYQGQEQHYSGGADPFDREAVWLSGYNTNAQLYQHVKSMNAIRQLAIAKSNDYLTWHSQVVYSDAHNVAFRKGDSSYMILMVTNNLGSSAGNYTVNMANVGFPAGLTVVDVLSCTKVVAGSDGSLTASFKGGEPMV